MNLDALASVPCERSVHCGGLVTERHRVDVSSILMTEAEGFVVVLFILTFPSKCDMIPNKPTPSLRPVDINPPNLQSTI